MVMVWCGVSNLLISFPTSSNISADHRRCWDFTCFDRLLGLLMPSPPEILQVLVLVLGNAPLSIEVEHLPLIFPQRWSGVVRPAVATNAQILSWHVPPHKWSDKYSTSWFSHEIIISDFNWGLSKKIVRAKQVVSLLIMVIIGWLVGTTNYGQSHVHDDRGSNHCGGDDAAINVLRHELPWTDS